VLFSGSRFGKKNMPNPNDHTDTCEILLNPKLFAKRRYQILSS